MIYLAHIRTAFELSNRTYGSPRMHRELVDEGSAHRRRRTARLMRENGLAARQKRRFKTNHGQYARLAGRAQSAGPRLRGRGARPEMERRHLLHLDRRGMALSRRAHRPLLTTCRRLGSQRQAEEGLALRALRMALVTRHPPSGLIHHSDSESIGDDGARALAAQTNLTSLDLRSNNIGADGARALAALTNLTSLDLRSNSIGAGGARALAELTNLTSLDLRSNGIGADGARILLHGWADASAAEQLETLDLRENGDLSSVLPP